MQGSNVPPILVKLTRGHNQYHVVGGLLRLGYPAHMVRHVDVRMCGIAGSLPGFETKNDPHANSTRTRVLLFCRATVDANEDDTRDRAGKRQAHERSGCNWLSIQLQ